LKKFDLKRETWHRAGILTAARLGLVASIFLSGAARAAEPEPEQMPQEAPGEPGIGWQYSPFSGEPPPYTSWGDVENSEKPAEDLPPPPIDERVTIKRGDTLKAVLMKFGIEGREAELAIRALAKSFKPRYLQPGHELFLQIQPAEKAKTAPGLLSIDFTADNKTDIALIRDGKGGFVSQKHDREIGKRLAYGAGGIQSSLYEAGMREGIPPQALINMINIFSFDVDFQRDIRRNDQFALLYERLTDETGSAAGIGQVIFARLKVHNRDIKLYRFKLDDGKIDYFDRDGRSVKKFLLSTPTDGARISSGFGRRRHPVLGYSKMHKGIDFAAPRGTPVYASGDGVVEVAKRFGSYGNYIRIRHNKTYKTAYAHLNGFAKGIRSGVRVRQRRVIGYIGTTGRSTGPHLHYEVIYNGKQVNPRGVRIPTGITLKGKEKKRFDVVRGKIDHSLESLRKGAEAQARKGG
jgi:murein DD-endopeptidase MepM/ murein hydrolase activator NlpD